MLLKNDKIKLVKPMGCFDNIGEICEVVNINEDGSICFKFGEYHLGCMSYNEYEKYFEKVNSKDIKQTIKHQWTEWLKCADNDEYLYKTNWKRVIVKDKITGIKSRSNCHPEDKFILDKGITLATLRIKRKIVLDKYYDLKSELSKIDTQINNVLKNNDGLDW